MAWRQGHRDKAGHPGLGKKTTHIPASFRGQKTAHPKTPRPQQKKSPKEGKVTLKFTKTAKVDSPQNAVGGTTPTRSGVAKGHKGNMIRKGKKASRLNGAKGSALTRGQAKEQQKRTMPMVDN